MRRKLASVTVGLMAFSVLGIAFAAAAGDPHIEAVGTAITLGVTAFPTPTICLGTDGHHYNSYTGVTATATGVTIPYPGGTTIKGAVTIKANFTVLDQDLGEPGEPANGWATATVTLKKNGVVRFKGTATLVVKDSVTVMGLLAGIYYDAAAANTGYKLRANMTAYTDLGAGQLHASFGGNTDATEYVAGLPSVISDFETC